MLNYPQESLKSSDGGYSNSIQATNVSKQMYISEFTFTHEKRKIYPGKINYLQESMKSSIETIQIPFKPQMFQNKFISLNLHLLTKEEKFVLANKNSPLFIWMTPKLQIKHRAKTAIDFDNAQISFASLTRVENASARKGNTRNTPRWRNVKFLQTWKWPSTIVKASLEEKLTCEFAPV